MDVDVSKERDLTAALDKAGLDGAAIVESAGCVRHSCVPRGDVCVHVAPSSSGLFVHAAGRKG